MQLQLEVERPFYFVPVARDGTRLAPILVVDHDWREAECWAYLAIREYEDNNQPKE